MRLATRAFVAPTRALYSRDGLARLHPADWLPSASANTLRLSAKQPFDTTDWARQHNPRAKHAQYLSCPVNVAPPAGSGSSGGRSSASGLLALQDVVVLNGPVQKGRYGDLYVGLAVRTSLVEALVAGLRSSTSYTILDGVQGGTSRIIDGEAWTSFPAYLRGAAVYGGKQVELLKGGLVGALSRAAGDLRAAAAFRLGTKYRGERLADEEAAPMQLHLDTKVLLLEAEEEAVKKVVQRAPMPRARWKPFRTAPRQAPRPRPPPPGKEGQAAASSGEWKPAARQWFMGQYQFTKD